MLVEAELTNAFIISLACVPCYLVTLAYYLVSAIPFSAALCHLAVRVDLALFIALQEMRTLIVVAASAQTFEVVVTVVLVELLPMQAYGWVHTAIC